MARSFNDILAEVKAKSDPQRKIVLNQISSLPSQQKTEETSLAAKKDKAFDDIIGGARQRGLGFSGIPLGEQAEYAATEYAPAVANLKTSFGERRSTLESALADIGSQNYATAQDIFDRDRTFAESQRQFNENLRLQQQQARQAAASTFSPTLGSGTSAQGNSPRLEQKAPGSFAFYGANNKPITAAQYAKQSGTTLSDLLYDMAQSGDRGAADAYSLIRERSRTLGNDRAIRLTAAQYPHILGGL